MVSPGGFWLSRSGQGPKFRLYEELVGYGAKSLQQVLGATRGKRPGTIRKILMGKKILPFPEARILTAQI